MTCPPTPGEIALADQVMATIRDLDAGLLTLAPDQLGDLVLTRTPEHPRTVTR